MQKVITHPKTKITLKKKPQEILEIWKNAQGIWRKKKNNPTEYLQKIRKEWERKSP